MRPTNRNEWRKSSYVTDAFLHVQVRGGWSFVDVKGSPSPASLFVFRIAVAFVSQYFLSLQVECPGLDASGERRSKRRKVARQLSTMPALASSLRDASGSR